MNRNPDRARGEKRGTLRLRLISAAVLAGMFGLILIFSACGMTKSSYGLKEGYYTAVASRPYMGWVDCATSCVKKGKIVTVEYFSRNASGFIKTWDMKYMREMRAKTGTYPYEYLRIFKTEALARQSANVDAVSGATQSREIFQSLVAATIEMAKKGDESVSIVDISWLKSEPEK